MFNLFFHLKRKDSGSNRSDGPRRLSTQIRTNCLQENVDQVERSVRECDANDCQRPGLHQWRTSMRLQAPQVGRFDRSGRWLCVQHRFARKIEHYETGQQRYGNFEIKLKELIHFSLRDCFYLKKNLFSKNFLPVTNNSNEKSNFYVLFI